MESPVDVARREAANGAHAILSAGPDDCEWARRIAVQFATQCVVGEK